MRPIQRRGPSHHLIISWAQDFFTALEELVVLARMNKGKINGLLRTAALSAITLDYLTLTNGNIAPKRLRHLLTRAVL